jgi:hypothetical protein
VLHDVGLGEGDHRARQERHDVDVHVVAQVAGLDEAGRQPPAVRAGHGDRRRAAAPTSRRPRARPARRPARTPCGSSGTAAAPSRRCAPSTLARAAGRRSRRARAGAGAVDGEVQSPSTTNSTASAPVALRPVAPPSGSTSTRYCEKVSAKPLRRDLLAVPRRGAPGRGEPAARERSGCRGRAVRRRRGARPHRRRRAQQARARRLRLPAARPALDGPQPPARSRCTSTGSARRTSRSTASTVPTAFVTSEQEATPIAMPARRPVAHDPLRRAERPAARHARQRRHLPARRVIPFARRTSWSTGCTSSRARRSTG